MADSESRMRSEESHAEDDNELSEDIDEELEEPPRAPRYPVPQRRLAAVEVPAVVENIDRTIKAFGRTSALSYVS